MKAADTPIQNSDRSTPPTSATRPKRLGLSLGIGWGAGSGGVTLGVCGFSRGTVCPNVLTILLLGPESAGLFQLNINRAGFTGFPRPSQRKRCFGPLPDAGAQGRRRGGNAALTRL